MKQRLLPVVGVLLLLGGCNSLSGAFKEDPTADQFYRLDTRHLRFCKGETALCQELTSVVSVRYKLGPIEEAYGERIKGPNYAASLASMILTPPDGSYRSEAMDADKRYYRVPINDKTNTVWKTLDAAYGSIYR
jgi:hypothetical protein